MSMFQKVDYPLELDVFDLCSDDLRKRLEGPRKVFAFTFNQPLCNYELLLVPFVGRGVHVLSFTLFSPNW